jgi:hypothetical protein
MIYSTSIHQSGQDPQPHVSASVLVLDTQGENIPNTHNGRDTNWYHICVDKKALWARFPKWKRGKEAKKKTRGGTNAVG